MMMTKAELDLIVPRQYRRRNNGFTRTLGRLLLGISGWRIIGALPDVPKVVVIVAPHTSAWDFVVGVAVLFALDIHIAFLAKHTLFTGMFGRFIRAIGGIAVERTKPNGVVADAVSAITAAERMVFALAPEGTRKLDRGFKTGFLHIAHGARVPICLAYFDFEKKVVGFGKLITPSGDVPHDMERIIDFYQPIRGRYRKVWQNDAE
jgi:1-acyl-sn-glycerol-3-phosphate acyltransferase